MDALLAQTSFFISHNVAVVFPVVYVVTIFGGNIAAFLMFLTAFAAHFEAWRVMAVFGIIAGGEFSGDMIWFNLGRGLRNTRFGGWVKNHLPGHDRAEQALQQKGKKFLYLSKFAYGSAAVVVFLLGWSGMEFRTLAKNSIMSIIVALPVVFIIAYGLFAGLSPLTAVAQFKHLEILFFFAVIAFFALEWALTKVVRIVFSDTDKE